MRLLELLIRDVRYSVRSLAKRPAFAIVAVLSLAIGIGANTAIFSVVNSFLLKELPYENPDELVDIHLRLPDFLFTALSYPDFDDLRAGTADVFADAIGSQTTLGTIEGISGSQGVFGEVVTGNYFSALGVEAAIGRTIGPDDDRIPGGHPVVMLSYDLWQEGFGGDPNIVGREIRIDETVLTVIGVVSADYPGISRGIIQPGFYAPMMMVNQLSPGNLLNARDNHNMFAKARLAPGVSIAQAQAAVAAAASGLSEERPTGWDPAGTFELAATSDVIVSPNLDSGIRSIAWVLMAVVGSILIVVCVNLTGFLLARAMDRRQEVALHVALGATRGALIRQPLIEATLLGLLGGAIGYGLAVSILSAGITIDLGIGVLLNPDLRPDISVLLFSFGVSLLAGLLLAFVPALQSTNPDVAATIKNESAAGRPPRMRWRNALVVTQLTVSLVILVSAGLFLRSLQEQSSSDPGFGQLPAAAITLDLPAERFDEEQGRVVANGLREQFEALPGVGTVGFIHSLPLSGGVQWIDFLVDGFQPPEDRETFQADYGVVGGDFFEAAGIAVAQGRAFDGTETADGQRVAIVSREFARRFWPDEDPIGQTVRMTGGSPALPGGAADLRVVGVANDVDWEALNEEPRMVVYVPFEQFYTQFVTFVAGTSIDAERTAIELRATTEATDSSISIIRTTTLEQHIGARLGPARILATLLGAFALVVLVLAIIGLHGVVSYAVATRTREVGIRMALGADRSRISRLVVASGVRLVLIGITAGLLLSLPVNRVLSGVLVGVGSLDGISLVGASLVLCATALLAAYLPARRAGRVDPVVALRNS